MFHKPSNHNTTLPQRRNHSPNPLSGIYSRSQATFDLYIEVEKVRLHEGTNRRYFLIVIPHIESRRVKKIVLIPRISVQPQEFLLQWMVFLRFAWDEASQKENYKIVFKHTIHTQAVVSSPLIVLIKMFLL